MATDILVVAAHPDDEVLGCGGTISRHVQEGDRVAVLILGEGVTSRSGERSARRKDVVRLRRDAERTAELLGVHKLVLRDFPDNRFDTVALLDVVKVIEAAVETVTPHVVYTHHPGDLNIDHVVTFRAVMTATRPVPQHPVETVYSFEVASASEWSFQRLGAPFRPTVFVDISRTIEAKIQAMESYGGEVRKFPHPRSAESLRAAARHWGSVVGLDFAEPFELIRTVRRA